MNRRVLFAIALSFAVVWLFQRFIQKDTVPQDQGASGQVKAGQIYTAPAKATWHREPKLEIDFVDTEVKEDQEQALTVQTPLYEAKFTNFGGILQSLAFSKHKGKAKTPLVSISSDSIEQREEGCFLLALDEKTPYLYKLISQEKIENSHKIVYETEADEWLLRKTYVLHDGSYKIDMLLDFEPKKKEVQPLLPRLFYPAPYVPEIPNNDISAFVARDGVNIEKVPQNAELNSVWGLPELFGADDKYFAHTLVKDGRSFSQGGYYKRVNKKLFAILEGPSIKEKKSWELNFYFGPKLLGDLSFVDERLEGVLHFGWLSWICKLLLRLLEWLYKLVGNFGLAIILMTFLIKLPFLPLSIRSRKKMEEYQKYQPTITRIRNKYKGDVQRQQAEVMRFHQEHNLSPATPMLGCLPLLLQMPILFALYRILNNYLSLYHAPLFGWLHDLSARDPYYILPIAMGLTMIIQQRLSPVADEKQRMMMMFMPILMTAIFINFPAGLVLYWFINNLLTLLEDLLRKKVFS